MENKLPENYAKLKVLIIVLSIAIPAVVAILFSVPKIEGYDFSFLPPIYATINGLTALFLVFALIAIKRKKIALHNRYINLSMILSLLFLVGYVLYHLTSDPTPYGNTGVLKTLYFILLISHILLSIVIIPFVLFTYLFAYTNQIEKHRKWAKITWPLWFYVAVSGVLVFLMISPFYK